VPSFSQEKGIGNKQLNWTIEADKYRFGMHIIAQAIPTAPHLSLTTLRQTYKPTTPRRNKQPGYTKHYLVSEILKLNDIQLGASL